MPDSSFPENSAFFYAQEPQAVPLFADPKEIKRDVEAQVREASPQRRDLQAEIWDLQDWIESANTGSTPTAFMEELRSRVSRLC